MGVLPRRGPLALLLLVADREGRLVWRDEGSFALLEPPQHRPIPYQYAGIALASLRLLDRRWESVVQFAPPLLAMLAAVAMLPYRSLWITALVLVVLAMVYLAAMLAVQLLASMIKAARQWARKDHESPEEELPGTYWSMPFSHHGHGDDAQQLFDDVLQRLHRLVVARAELTAQEGGAWTPVVESTETLVCIVAGATTEPMRAAILTAAVASGGEEPDPAVVVIASTTLDPRRDRRPVPSGSFALLYLACLAVMIAVQAVAVADMEGASCTVPECPGRPTTYPLAVRWLVQRLYGSDPAGLSPATTGVWVFGWLTTLAGFMAVPVLVVAALEQRKANAVKRARHQAIIDRTRQATVLLLVASSTERDAVIAAVQEVRPMRIGRRFVGSHTVFTLGSVGGATVLLAQCEQGTVAPGASTLTAQSLISRLRPDYLLLVGICYGLQNSEQRLGDVLVSSQLKVADHKKVVDAPEAGAGRDSTVEIPRGDRISPSTTLLDRCRGATADWQSPPGIHFGLVISANVLMDSETERRRVLAGDPEAVGGEMEGAGVYAAAASGKTDWILVKGISDWGAGKEGPGHPHQRRLAAENAARFVAHVMNTGGLAGPPATEGRR